MKTVPNRITGLPPVKEGGSPPTYADLLKTALDFPPQDFVARLPVQP